MMTKILLNIAFIPAFISFAILYMSGIFIARFIDYSREKLCAR